MNRLIYLWYIPGKLTLKIPWKNLYGAPTIATLEGLYIVAVPNAGKFWVLPPQEFLIPLEPII